MNAQDVQRVLTALLTGSTVAAGRIISVFENDGASAPALFSALFPHTGKAHIVGITGPPGSGKSTLVNALIAVLRRQDQRVGVVAVDPSSPFTGGALLGDRVRMQEHSTDPQVFVRSMATRGSLGGLAPTTGEAVAVLDAWGAQTILLETVGTGQAEVDVVSSCDTVVVVTTPGLGDGVQSIKAGIMEIGDIFVVNKADRPDADRAVQELKVAIGLVPVQGWVPPVLTTVATTAEGVGAVLDAVAAHRAHQARSGGLRERRLARWKREIVRAAEAELRAAVLDSGAGRAIDALAELVAAGQLDPRSAATRLVAGRPATAFVVPDAPRALPGPRPIAPPIAPEAPTAAARDAARETAPGAVVVVDHIGIAVRSLEAAGRFYRDVLGVEPSAPQHIPDDGVIASFVELGETRIELLESAGPESAIGRFIERRGEGIHHIAIRVPDVAVSLAAARAAGMALVDATPRRGAHETRIGFLHPKSTHGVLIELVER
jgi:LAO/AO transport system kinase